MHNQFTHKMLSNLLATTRQRVQSAQAIPEYVLVLGIISLSAIGAMNTMSLQINTMYGSINAQLAIFNSMIGA